MKSTFFERLLSYIIDAVLLTLISSLICLGLPDKSTDAEKKLDELSNKLIASEITSESYVKEYGEIMYDNQKENLIPSAVNLVLIIGYFVVFQYMNKGQTLGKKLLGIRVVDNKDEKPISIARGLVRSLFTLSIISSAVNIIFIYLLNRNNYFIAYGLIGSTEFLFILITIIFILYRKDGRGLHDMMANSKVIKEGRG